MFSGASNFVTSVDNAFLFIFSISIFFFIALNALMIFFIIKYNKKKHAKAVQIKENLLLEITWTIIPLILVLLMFWVGLRGYITMRKVPKDALTIKTVAKMWDWNFVYPNKKESKILVVPLNKPVRLDLVSLDIVHGFYIPEFRVKEDAVPGYNNYTWFIPQIEGEYEIMCSAYCGLRHSFMSTTVNVVSETEYNKWITELPAIDTSEHPGLTIIRKNACTGCHSLGTDRLVGPAFKGLYGSKKTVITEGKERTITVDDKYIKNSIIKPDLDIVKDYSKGLMQSYESILKDEDIQKITDYLKKMNEQK